MQVQNQNLSTENILEKQINQLFTEVISVWRETDIKKSQAVRMLAARMEEYYLQQQQPQEIQYICRHIVEKLKAAGLDATANHAYDYLEDKYKQPGYQHSRSGTGANADNNLIEQILRTDPLEERTSEQMQILDEYAKMIAIARESNRQAAVIRKVALDSDSDYLSRKQYEKVRTDIPNYKYTGPVYHGLELYVEDLGKYYNDMVETLDDLYHWYQADKIPEKPFVAAIEMLRNHLKDMRCIIAPAKDLKYATSMHNWFHTLIKFLEHGKHAGGVMTSIASAKHFRTKSDGTIEAEKRPLTREQVGDRVDWVEDLLERYSESKAFMSDLRAYLKGTGDWNRDDRVRYWRKEFVTKLVHHYADDGDFNNWLSFFREKTMDEEVAARRIDLREPLSDLA